MAKRTLSPAELEAFRRLLFFSVPEAASWLGNVSEQSWRRWEAGARGVPVDVADLIGEILDKREQRIRLLRQAAKQSPSTETFPLLWYPRLDDWHSFEGGGPTLWRVHQSACAVLLHELQGRARLVPFNAASYASWLADRVDSADLRDAWAADQLQKL